MKYLTIRHFKQLKFAVIILITLPLSGCFTQADQQKQALELVEIAHNAIQSKDWAPLMSHYSDDFFLQHNKEEWLSQLQTTFEKGGKLNAIKQTFNQKNPRLSGDFYIYGYSLQFEHMITQETITIFKGIDDDKLSITGHIFKTREFKHE